MATNGDQFTGTGGYIAFDGAGGPVSIPLTSFSGAMRRTMRDKTNSTNYAPGIGLFTPTQVAIAVSTTITVSGWYRVSTTPGEIIARMNSDEENVPVYLGISDEVPLGHGNFDITDFQCDVPCDDTVSFSCTLTSNGPFYPNS